MGTAEGQTKSKTRHMHSRMVSRMASHLARQMAKRRGASGSALIVRSVTMSARRAIAATAITSRSSRVSSGAKKLPIRTRLLPNSRP